MAYETATKIYSNTLPATVRKNNDETIREKAMDIKYNRSDWWTDFSKLCSEK